MKKIVYFIVLFVFIFTGCRKEDNDPTNNQLIIVDKNGNTTISQPLTDTRISGSFDPTFGGYAATPSDDYRFSIGPFRGYTPSSITFTSPSYTNSIGMYISTPTGSWEATAGTAEIKYKSGSALFFNGGTKFMKVTFNNVRFTRESTYSTPIPAPDTIWVSGIINMYR